MISIRALSPEEFHRVGEIDRSEHIDELIDQRGEQLTPRPGNWDAAPWDPDGDGDHSVEAQRRAIAAYVAEGGTALGAFDDDGVPGDRLVGVGVVVPRRRPGIAQLAYLHVSRHARGSGIGRRLSEALDEIARRAGATTIVVSATPSANTVRFYRARGYRPTADPLPELLAAEPEDVHLAKPLGHP